MLKAFFINLDQAPQRRAHIEVQLQRVGILADRVSGIDGRNLPTNLACYFDLEGNARHSLTAGQIGCQASHLKVMKLILERDLSSALVLEDDAVLAHDLSDILTEVLDELPASWDIVKLCRASTRAVRPLLTLSGDRLLVRYSRVPVGRAGYLVSREGAAKLLTPRKMCRPGDDEISQSWHLGLDVYGVTPPPISQERGSLPTTIGVERGGLNKVTRAIPSPRRFAFHFSKLGPYWWARCFARNAVTKIERWMGQKDQSLRQVRSGVSEGLNSSNRSSVT